MSRQPARLKRRSDFLRVASGGRKWVAPGLILQVRPFEGDERSPVCEPIRVGFTVSRKVGGAVVRNRARRRLHAAAELVMPAHAATGRDYVVIGRAATVRRSFSGLAGDLEAALKRLGAWRDGGQDRGGAGNEGRNVR